MRPFIITPDTARTDAASLIDAYITHQVRLPGGGRFRKGHQLTANDAPLLARLDHEIHAVRLDPGDVPEDEAGMRLADLIAGPGIAIRAPVQSRVNLAAAVKGLLRVDAEAIHAINRNPPAGVFTMLDRLPVVPGKIVAGAKIATVAVDRQVLDDIAAIVAARPGPVLEVRPYLPQRVGVVVTEGLAEGVRNRFETSVRLKMNWYGSEVIGFSYVANDPAEVETAIAAALNQGATVILTAGGNMMDPLDASLVAVPAIGASMVRLGAPAHPGSMFWLAELTEHAIPIVNLASCSMYSKATVADLVLPWVMAGETVTGDDLASIGYGGMLDRDMSWRFPAYDVDSVDEPDEE